ncbi:hypothetical protein VTO42DRAFT_1817 [Malbranchea cinnamomea]
MEPAGAVQGRIGTLTVHRLGEDAGELLDGRSCQRAEDLVSSLERALQSYDRALTCLVHWTFFLFKYFKMEVHSVRTDVSAASTTSKRSASPTRNSSAVGLRVCPKLIATENKDLRDLHNAER